MELERKLDINVIHVKSLAESGDIKDYAFFLLLKSKYKNSCIYNYNTLSLSKKLGVSRTSVKKRISSLLSRKWCKLEHGHLICCKLKNIDDNKQKVIISFNIKDKVKDILKDLYLAILRYKQQQFDNLKQLRRDIFYPQNLQTFLIANRRLRRMKISKDALPRETDQLQISIKSIAKLLGCSVGKTHNVLKWHKYNKNIICVSGRRQQVAVTDSLQHARTLLEKYPGCYYSNGVIYKTKRNMYWF